jgi:hypothetical protein
MDQYRNRLRDRPRVHSGADLHSESAGIQRLGLVVNPEQAANSKFVCTTILERARITVLHLLISQHF